MTLGINSVIKMQQLPAVILAVILGTIAGECLKVEDRIAAGLGIMLATGFRISGIKWFPIANMIPAMILVMPFSWIWMTFIA